MIERLPELLNGHSMARKAVLHPSSMSVTLNVDNLSTASLLLLPTDPDVNIGDWVRIWTPHESSVYVVRSVETNTVDSLRTVEVEHAFGLLLDRVIFGEIKPSDIVGTAARSVPASDEDEGIMPLYDTPDVDLPAYGGTALPIPKPPDAGGSGGSSGGSSGSGSSGVKKVSLDAAARYLLAGQGETVWQWGGTQIDTTQGWVFRDTTIYAGLNALTQCITGWQWHFDMDTLPWTVSIVRRPITPTCEMRFSRNISTMTTTVSMDGMVTRLYPIGDNGLVIDDAQPYIEKNVNVWGLASKIEKNEAISDKDLLRAWGSAMLESLAVPQVTVTIAGLDLAAATGEPLDRLVLGTVCRVPLPEYNTTISERIVSLSWPDLMADQYSVTVTLANVHETMTDVIQKMAGGGGGGGAKATEEEIKRIWTEFEKTDEWIRLAAYNIGVMYSDMAEIRITAEQITSVVQRYEYDDFGDMLDGWWTRINQSASAIELAAVQTSLNNLDQRVTTAESQITLVPGEIELWVKNNLGSSWINLQGDGITISGGQITLDGDTLVNKLGGKTLSMHAISTVEANIDELEVGTLNGRNIYLCTMTVGETEVGQFFGPADITFDWRDIKEVKDAIDAARESVTLAPDPINIIDETYNTTKTITVDVDVRLTNGHIVHKTINVGAQDAYDAGADSVTAYYNIVTLTDRRQRVDFYMSNGKEYHATVVFV